MPRLRNRNQLMGSVLASPSASRAAMLRRDNEACPMRQAGSRDKDRSFTTGSFSSPHAPSSVPLNSEMLRELKRRVLVCLDNNAAAAEVARRLLSDRNSDFTKLSGIGRRSCPESSTVRRKGDGGERGTSPFEIVSECFEMLDRLLSDIARKDAEIERLQKELAAAERLCRSFESRVSQLQESCSRFGRLTCSGALERVSKADPVSAASTGIPSPATAPRSPRKPRRSSMEMLSLPSIHDTGEAVPLEPALAGCGVRKRTAEAVEAGGAKRCRVEAKCKEEPKDLEDDDEMRTQPKNEDKEELRTDLMKARSRKGKKKRGGRLSVTAAALAVSGPEVTSEERLSQRFGPYLTTAQSYYYGDFDSMLERRERERERRRAEAEIHTPGWRIAPACGRTRAATAAAAVGSTNGEACSLQADSEMPEEGAGFAEWAALSDEPFEARHRRLEQQEQKRDRAELRAIRERQRHARLRQRQIYVGLPTAGSELQTAEHQLHPVAGKEPFGGVGAVPAAAAAAPASDTDVATAAVSVTGSSRRGLPESLLPSGLEEGEAKDCCIYYYPKDRIPVVAFGRLLPARRKKSQGFALPWMPKKGR